MSPSRSDRLPRFPGRALAALVLAAGWLAAPARGQNLIVRNYTALDGLQTSRILDVREAPSGLPWFATDRGVFEYDGSSWRPVLRDVLSGEKDVEFLRFDGGGEPWVVCQGGLVLDGSALGRSPTVDRSRAEVLRDFEVLGEREVELALCWETRGLRLWRAGRWSSPDLGGAERRAYAVEACLGRLFVGTAEGLWVLEGDGARRVEGLPGRTGAAQDAASAVRGLGRETGPRGELLWVAGNGWLGVVVESEGELRFALRGTDLPVFLRQDADPPLAVAGDGQGGAAYACDWGLCHFDGARGRVFGRRSGLVANGARSLALDSSGMLWGATSVGAFKILGFDVLTWGVEDGLYDDEVTAIAELPGGGLALGHFGGLTLLRGGLPEHVVFPEVKPESWLYGRVIDLYVDRSRRLWVAGGLGLGVLEEERGAVRWLALPEAGTWVNAVQEDASGTLLVGTDAGLFRLEGERLIAVEGVRNHFVRRITVGRDGTVYLATAGGVLVRRNGLARTLRSVADPLAPDSFFTVLEDHAGTVWCGRSDGLWKIEGDLLVPAGEAWNPGRAVYSLTEDRRGRLWMGTDLGLAYSDGRRLTALSWLVDHTGAEANRAAALTDREGRVWMGTTGGLTAFAPGFDVARREPELELLDARIGGQLRSLAGPLRIDAGRSDLVFRARARAAFSEDRIVFRSRMEGFDEWRTVEGSTVLEAHYTGLPPGRYRFEIQARGVGGTFGPSLRSPWIDVAGPWWTRWWGLAGMLALSSLASLAVQRWLTRGRQIRRLRAEFEVRTRELEVSLQELAKTDRLRSLGSLAGGIAHDLRNVLTVLEGNLSILRERCAGLTGTDECFEATDQAVERATQLSSQLQTFATGGTPLTSAVPLGALVADCANLALAGSRVRFELQLEDGLWPAEADQGQIRQVFENLLLNARQCQGAEGWIRVTGTNAVLGPALAGGGPGPGRYVRFTVTDGGPGIPQDVLQHVFDPFFTTREEGTGLGLATALSIVNRHGGQLSVASTSAQGTTFRLLLPAAEEQAVAAGGSAPRGRPDPGGVEDRDGPREAVLVVDDEPHIRRMLVAMLAGLGYEGRPAGGGDEACAMLERARTDARPIRLAIVDLTLPGDAKGDVILQRLRAIEPELRAAASSGYCADAVLAHPQAFGFQVALPKPYRTEELAEALAVLTRGTQAAPEHPREGMPQRHARSDRTARERP